MTTCTRGTGPDPDALDWYDPETGKNRDLLSACPDCGHIIILHPNRGNPALTACVICEHSAGPRPVLVHNHPDIDVKPRGECVGCDFIHDSPVWQLVYEKFEDEPPMMTQAEMDEMIAENVSHLIDKDGQCSLSGPGFSGLPCAQH